MALSFHVSDLSLTVSGKRGSQLIQCCKTKQNTNCKQNKQSKQFTKLIRTKLTNLHKTKSTKINKLITQETIKNKKYFNPKLTDRLHFVIQVGNG